MTYGFKFLPKLKSLIAFVICIKLQGNLNRSKSKSKGKLLPDKTNFLLAAVKFFDHVITENKIRPFLNKNEAIQQMKRPESEKHVYETVSSSKLIFEILSQHACNSCSVVDTVILWSLLIGTQNAKLFSSQ